MPPNLSKHLVAYYPFCGNANDMSGNNNNPIYNNATLINDRFGNANSAYGFNRSLQQYIEGSCSNYPVNQRTVSVWFKAPGSTLNNEILGYGGSTCGTSFFICLNAANRISTYNVSGHCGANDCRETAVVPDRTWSNFVVVNDKKNTKFYLNGVLIKTFEGITFKNTSVTGKDFAFGSIPAADGYAPNKDVNVNFLDGSLDDIVIYDSAINDAGVMQLYQYFKTDPTAKASVVFDQSGLQLTDVSSSISITASPNPSNGAITDYSETLKTYQAALKTAEETGNKARMASFYNRIGNAYFGQTNYTEALKNYQAAIENYQAAIKIWEELGNKGEIASAYFSIGTIYNQQGNYPEAISNCQTGVKIAEETGDKALLAFLYNDFGVMYANHGNGPEALKNFLAALKFFEETGDKSGVVLGYNNTGAMYMEQGNYPEALKNFVAALKISEQIKDQRMIAFSHTNLGELYSKQGNYQEALNNYRVALKIWPDEEAIGECYADIGTIYYYLGNYPEALKNHLASQKIFLETGYKSGIADSYINIGLVYIKLNKYPEAKQYLINGLALSKEIGARWKIKDAYDGLSKLDSAMGNYELALVHYKLYSDYKDSVLNETNIKQMAQMKEQYESEKKDKEILQLTTYKQNLENEKQLTALLIKSKSDSLLLVQSEKKRSG